MGDRQPPASSSNAVTRTLSTLEKPALSTLEEPDPLARARSGLLTFNRDSSIATLDLRSRV
jgi:hypothetical protein